MAAGQHGLGFRRRSPWEPSCSRLCSLPKPPLRLRRSGIPKSRSPLRRLGRWLAV